MGPKPVFKLWRGGGKSWLYRDSNDNSVVATIPATSSQLYQIVINVIIFMQDIYNYIPETNHVSRVYNVAAVLYLQFVLHVMLFFL